MNTDKNYILTYFKRISNPNIYDGNKTNWKYLKKNDLEMYEYLKSIYPNIDNTVTV